MSDIIQFEFQGNFSLAEKEKFIKSQLSDLNRLCKYLQIDLKQLEIIKYFVFDTQQGKINADPNHSISRAVARYNENAIYRYWDKIEDPSFPHELTHLVAHHFDVPYILHTEVDQANGEKLNIDIEMVSTSFMQEGLAIAVDDIVFNKKLKEDGEYKFIDEWCKEQLDLMPDNLDIAMKDFDTLPNKIIIPFTASLSKYLINKYGIEMYKKVYCSQKETNTVENNIKVWEEVYKKDAMSILKNWKFSLLTP